VRCEATSEWHAEDEPSTVPAHGPQPPSLPHQPQGKAHACAVGVEWAARTPTLHNHRMQTFECEWGRGWRRKEHDSRVPLEDASFAAARGATLSPHTPTHPPHQGAWPRTA
jgi:hypothetical protein